MGILGELQLHTEYFDDNGINSVEMVFVEITQNVVSIKLKLRDCYEIYNISKGMTNNKSLCLLAEILVTLAEIEHDTDGKCCGLVINDVSVSAENFIHNSYLVFS